MGWDNCHLFGFRHSNFLIQVPDEFDDDFGLKGKTYKKINPKNLLLKEYFNAEKVRITYEYDFGDSWTHAVTLQKVLDLEKEKQYPFCIKAKRNCPGEDCGSFSGYMNLLKIMENKKTSGV